MADLEIRLTPRGGRDAITEIRDGVVHARVRAAPVDGQANDALCRLLARALGVAPSRVGVLRGHTARTKVVRVDGLDTADAHELLRASS